MKKKILVSNIFCHFLFALSLGNWASKMSEKFRLDRKIGFQNTLYTKCITVIIESIGPSVILRSKYIERSSFFLSTDISFTSLALWVEQKTGKKSLISGGTPPHL